MYRRESESEIETAAEKSFDSKFRIVEGRYHFLVGGTDWMLPVAEQEYEIARERCLLLTKIFKLLYYAAWAAASAYSLYVILAEDQYLKLVWIWLGYFALVAVLSVFAQTIPTMTMWRRLQWAQRLDEDSKTRVLVRRPELN